MTVNLIVCSLWRAPEYDRGRFNEKVDVYSYGVLVLFEIVRGGRVSLPNSKYSSRALVPLSSKRLEQVSLLASTSMCFETSLGVVACFSG